MIRCVVRGCMSSVGNKQGCFAYFRQHFQLPQSDMQEKATMCFNLSSVVCMERNVLSSEGKHNHISVACACAGGNQCWCT